VLSERECLPGLPKLEGFALADGGRRLDEEGRAVLEALLPFFALPTLTPERIRREDGDLHLVLGDSGTRVRLDARHAPAQLLKLRVFEESRGSDPLPAAIDLRFQNQVVVRDEGTGLARRRSR
jgi:hypothetical protein